MTLTVGSTARTASSDALPGRTGWSGRLDAARSGDPGLIIAALGVGVGGGLAAVGFRYLIEGVTRLLTGHDDYSDLGRVGNPNLPWLGGWIVLVLPVLAGLLYGPLVSRFAPQARGHGVPEVMYAVAKKGGRIPAPVAGVKALASALCIGAGGSVGREGPIVQVGSALGSSIGRLLRLPESRLRTLVACGAAAGIAATFNAPLAGVFFALELILAEFTATAFGPVVLAAVVASVIGRSVLGDEAFLSLPPFAVHSLTEYGLYALLGVLGAAVARLFTVVLYAVEDGCDKVWRRTGRPEWARPAAGGLLLGLLLLVLPQMYGVGYPVLDNAVAGRYTVVFLLVLVVGKILATSLTIGIGGSGGVFAPSLFLGAATGAAVGQLLHALIPGTVTQPGAYALIGMGAVFAGAGRAPITAVVILFELTGEYSIILPLMLAVVCATATSRALSADTIYTLKLRRRGIDLDAGRLPLPDVALATVMREVPAPLRESDPLEVAARRLQAAGGTLPVVHADGTYAGVVTPWAIENAVLELDAEHAEAGARETAAPTAGDLAVFLSAPHLDDGVRDAVRLLAGPDAAGGLPVLGPGACVVGWLDHQLLITALAGSRTGASLAPRLAVRPRARPS